MAFKARRSVGSGARQQKVGLDIRYGQLPAWGGIRPWGNLLRAKMVEQEIRVIFASLSLLDAGG